MRKKSRLFYDNNFKKSMLMDKMDAYLTEEIKNVNV